MLKNSYQEILVGLNLVSLVRGLVSLKRGLSTFLIHDHSYFSDSYPSQFISEMEVMAFMRLGKMYDIPELKGLRQFLTKANLELMTDQVRLKLGQTPFENLRETLRKYPELIEGSDLDLVYGESEEEFNHFLLEEMRRFEQLSFEARFRPKAVRFDFQGPKWLKTIYQRFGEFINQEYAKAHTLKYQGLLHLLGIHAEEKLKTKLSGEEIPFYFFRLLSPLYRLQDFFLITQLKRRLQLLGGDFKESAIQYWQFHQNRFENLLLKSFEGVISGKRVLFFSHLPVEAPFQIRSPYPFYFKSQIAREKNGPSPYPCANLIHLTDLDLMGSERPYRTIGLDDEVSFYHWPYPDMPGSKAQFYDRPMQESFHQDSSRVPFEKLSVSPKGILSASIDLRSLKMERRTQAPVLTRLPLEIEQDGKAIEGLEYWGPFRYKSLGMLSLCYGIEEN